MTESEIVAPGVEILPATWRDLNDVRALEHECFGRDAWSLFDLVGVLTLPATVRLKAVIENRMIGFAAGDIRKNEFTGWISTIGVLKAYRRLGVGSMLLHASEIALEMPKICLCVRQSNQPAIAMYARHGYHPIDLWAYYYEDGEDAIVMEKQMRLK